MRPPHHAGEMGNVQNEFINAVQAPSMRPPHHAGEMIVHLVEHPVLLDPSMRPPHHAGEMMLLREAVSNTARLQ